MAAISQKLSETAVKNDVETAVHEHLQSYSGGGGENCEYTVYIYNNIFYLM